MTIAERKSRERQEMRSLILETARALFVEEGFATVSIRRIAEKIEYSPATIYLYFKDKDEILYAVHNLGFEMLMEKFRDTATISDPFERLQAISRRYLEFAIEHPGYYDLMFIMRGPIKTIEEGSDEWNYGRKSFDFFNATVQECVDAGYLPADSREIAAFALWGYVHGVAALIIRRRCPMLDQDNIENIALASGDMLNQLIAAHKQRTPH
ncbi:TetR/AcrR family transcriptional regulator [candidate division KSB1 bacterium]|nr:TetR/AcrR family transcriptional regulator [candidate division KSB1 bacterium]